MEDLRWHCPCGFAGCGLVKRAWELKEWTRVAYAYTKNSMGLLVG